MKRSLAFGMIAILVAGFATTTQAALIQYTANMDGPSEAPPNASPGTGVAFADYDDVAHTLHVGANFSGLVAGTTAAHIHAPTAVPGAGTASVATQTPSFSGFPLGVTAGVFDNTFDLTLASSWNPSYIAANGGTPAGAEAAFALALAQGRAYFNIHSSAFPGGEIRGFLVPEPATIALLGCATLLLRRRR